MCIRAGTGFLKGSAQKSRGRLLPRESSILEGRRKKRNVKETTACLARKPTVRPCPSTALLCECVRDLLPVPSWRKEKKLQRFLAGAVLVEHPGPGRMSGCRASQFSELLEAPAARSLSWSENFLL